MFPSMLVFYKNLALTILYTAAETLSLGGTQQANDLWAALEQLSLGGTLEPNQLWTDAATLDSNTFFNQPNVLWLALVTLPKYDLQNNVLWTSTITLPKWVDEPNAEWTDSVMLTIPGTNLQP